MRYMYDDNLSVTCATQPIVFPFPYSDPPSSCPGILIPILGFIVGNVLRASNSQPPLTHAVASSGYKSHHSPQVSTSVLSQHFLQYPCPETRADRSTPRWGTPFTTSRVLLLLPVLAFVDPPTCQIGDHPELPQSSRNQPSSQPPEGKSNFGDSSGPIFSIYSNITKEEDDQAAERWQKDADGILIFVSPCVNIHTTTHISWIIIDRFIFRRSCRTTCHIRPGPQTGFSRHFRILPREYLSGSRQPERYVRPFSCRPASSVLSPEIFRLGEFTLVPELSY